MAPSKSPRLGFIYELTNDARETARVSLSATDKSKNRTYSRVDVEKLLKIRIEPEAWGFRGWLVGIDTFIDAELRHRFTSLNAKFGTSSPNHRGQGPTVVNTVTGIVAVSASASGCLTSLHGTNLRGASGTAAFVYELYPRSLQLARINEGYTTSAAASENN